MQNIQLDILVLVGLIVLVLLVFFIARNLRDKKKLFPPEKTDDQVNEEKMDQERGRDQV